MAGDRMQVEILEDGTIKVVTDGISPANHVSAENFLELISRLTGSEGIREKRKDAHAHVHAHDHHHHHDHAGH